MARRSRKVETTTTSNVRNVIVPHESSDESSSESDTNSDYMDVIGVDEEELDELLNENDAEQNDRGSHNPEHRPSAPTSSNQPSLPPRKRPYTFVTRQPRDSQPAKMRKKWKEDLDALFEDIDQVVCCKKLQCFKHCNTSFLKTRMKTVTEMTYDQRRLCLLDMKGSNGRFYFDGTPVCNTFLKKAFRFSADLISAVRSGTVKTRLSDSFGAASNSQSRSQTTSNSDRGPFQRDAIITSLERMAENSGDMMPDQDEIHLPHFRKRDVYQFFKDEFTILHGVDVKCPCKSYFYKTWKRHCRHIKVRKLGRFAKCTTCEQLRKSIHDAAARRDYKSLAVYRRKKAEHNELIAKERREYKKKRDKAKLQPDQFLSIIVDGADQSAFGLPHFMIKTKDDRGHSLKVRLIGLLEHNQQNQLRLFTLTEEYPTGANHVIEAIHRFLSERINQSNLPRTFFIQVDNCTKENNNRFLFSYVESLLRWKLFDEIVVAFLPVGHTHEDIDQTFSRTSDRLRCNDAVTLSDLHGELRQVYNDKTSVCSMNNVVNWSGLCEAERCLTNLKNFSKYRYFKFYRSQTSDSISCNIKVNVIDEWFDIGNLSARGSIRSFTKFAPDLSKTPPLHISCPDGKEKVTECIEAAESRIPSVEKVDALFSLRDKVFKERTEEFHWNLQHCVELNHSSLLREDECNLDVDDEIRIEQPTSIDKSHVNSDFRYDLNTFVAVKTEENEGPSFWIAKVNKVHRNDENIICRLTIHWFDKEGTQEAFNSKYFPSYNNVKSGSKRTPMKDDISVDSVIINFPSLTEQHRLPASVSQHLRTI